MLELLSETKAYMKKAAYNYWKYSKSEYYFISKKTWLTQMAVYATNSEEHHQL